MNISIYLVTRLQFQTFSLSGCRDALLGFSLFVWVCSSINKRSTSAQFKRTQAIKKIIFFVSYLVASDQVLLFQILQNLDVALNYFKLCFSCCMPSRTSTQFKCCEAGEYFYSSALRIGVFMQPQARLLPLHPHPPPPLTPSDLQNNSERYLYVNFLTSH